MESPFLRDIAETEHFILGNDFEEACLYDKVEHNFEPLGWFYGDPECGVINDDARWCVVGGDVLVAWRHDEVVTFDNEDLRWIHDLRISGPRTVQILTDPWGEHPAIWELDIDSLEYKKVRDFPDYRDKPAEKVVW